MIQVAGSIGNRKLLMALAGLCLIMGMTTPSLAQAPAAKGANMKPLIIGHRGAAGLAPENTLAAFARACELGVDGIELDVLVSADGELVVHHDFRLKPEIARTADGNWISSASRPAVKDLTVARLKTYDVGRLQPETSYAGRYPEQASVDGERIPTFKEVIELFKKSCNPSTRLFVEIKTSPEEPALTPPPEAVSEQVVRTLKEKGIVDRTCALSFDWRNLVHIQKIAPELVTVYLTVSTLGSNTLKPNQPGPSPWMAGFDIDDFNGSAPRAVKSAGGRIWAPFFKNLTQESLEEARRLGLGVSVWTPDRPEDLEQVIRMKVDAITTNRPDVLKKLLKE
jgi:glycerophosphoryl diester phosphodiesterase